MSSNLTQQGSFIKYNGYQFGLYSTSHVSAQPVLDTAKRSTLYVKYMIRVEETIIVDSNRESTDDILSDIRKRLTARGGALEMRGRGFGDLEINTGSGTSLRDVAMGPHPKILDATPLGGKTAWRISWSCETNIPECLEGTAKTADRVMAFNYTWGVRIDEHGYSVRSISGKLEIPATVTAGSRVQPDAADRWWEQVVTSFPLLAGFKRSCDRNLSEDRRTLSFSITDTEKDRNAFLPDITEWSGTQDLSTNMPQHGFTIWTNSIRATYRVARNKPKKVAAEHFFSLINSRAARTKAPWVTGQFVPVAMSVSDSLVGDETTFAFSYTYSVPNVRAALYASGLWQDVPKSDWEQWQDSLEETARHPRGIARLAYDPVSDSIIDLCESPTYPVLRTGELLSGKFEPNKYGMSATLPDPKNSWVSYECSAVYECDEGTESIRTLATAPLTVKKVTAGSIQIPDEDSLRSLATDIDKLTKKTNGLTEFSGTLERLPKPRFKTIPVPKVLVESNKEERNPIQKRAASAPRVIVRGRALRIAYPITPPKLVSAGGRPATLQKNRYSQKVIADPGIPIIAAAWEDTYLLDGRDTSEMPIPPNPLLGLT